MRDRLAALTVLAAVLAVALPRLAPTARPAAHQRPGLRAAQSGRAVSAADAGYDASVPAGGQRRAAAMRSAAIRSAASAGVEPSAAARAQTVSTVW